MEIFWTGIIIRNKEDEMTATEIRKLTELSRIAFCRKYGIPLRTMEDWESGKNKPADYLLALLERAVKEDFKIE